MNTQIDRTRLQPIIDTALQNGRVIDVLTLNKLEWLGLRNMLGLGGSDVATALGINHYKSAYKLWQEKVSDEIEETNNKFTVWGNLLEEPIIQVYEELTGKKVIREKKIRIHPEHDCLFANLDGIVEADNWVLEAKSTVSSVYKSWKDDENAQSIPLPYYAQVQHELSVTGFSNAVLVILLLDQREIKIIPIKRDEEYIQKQNKALVLWWNAYVLQNEAPPMTAAEFDYVDPLPGTFTEADDKTLKLCEDTQELQKEWNGLKKKIECNKDQIKEIIGNNELLVSGSRVIATYKTINKAEYVVKANSYRQLNFKKGKAE
jgi:putative phage-type endonuclease